MNAGNIAKHIWIAFQIVIGLNLVLPIFLYVLYLIKNRRTTLASNNIQELDYAIIVTAYEQTTLLPTVVNSILQLNYENYLIYIVADKCDVSDLTFSSDKVILLRPEQTLASNTRSHFYAVKNFRRAHNVLTIIDSDNLVHPDYLRELNKYFDKGYTAVQGVREAKNLNSTYACLDAARDIYYHFYDGKVLFGCGSSATLAGSGMAFTVTLYRQSLEHLDITGAGFDKVLQYAIVRKSQKIAFSEEAIVYDEKTSKSDQLIDQRARWINTWFKYFGYGFSLIKQGLVRFNWNQLLFGVVLLRPPLFMFILLSVLCLFVNTFFSFTAVIMWLIALILFVTGFMIPLLLHNTNKLIYQSLLNIPKFIFFQVVSLFHVKSADKRSVATIHCYDMEVKELKDESLKT